MCYKGLCLPKEAWRGFEHTIALLGYYSHYAKHLLALVLVAPFFSRASPRAGPFAPASTTASLSLAGPSLSSCSFVGFKSSSQTWLLEVGECCAFDRTAMRRKLREAQYFSKHNHIHIQNWKHTCQLPLFCLLQSLHRFQ